MDNPLLTSIDDLLRAAPNTVWSEHQLLKALVDQHCLDPHYARESLSLFRAHFLVMNALFQLQQTYLEQNLGFLSISALHIELSTQALSGERQLGIGAQQPLASYYLDWQHFRNANDASVDDLLSQFWQRFMRPSKRDKALALLGLEASASDADIKKKYRQRVMACHPDRGGDGDELIELNEAMSYLKGRS